jgi:cell division protein FtsB
MIKYLKKDNQRLNNEIGILKNSSTKQLNEQIQTKQNEIEKLNKENLELKKELNTYKYADKTIDEYKKKILY